MIEFLSGAWVSYAFGTLVSITFLASLFARDKRMIAMAVVVLGQWLISMFVIFAVTKSSYETYRITYALLNFGSFLILIQLNRGKAYDPNLWAFVAIFFEAIMLPSHFQPLFGLLGQWWHSFWVNICYLLVILTLLFGICHRLYLDWKSWQVYRYLGNGQPILRHRG